MPQAFSITFGPTSIAVSRADEDESHFLPQNPYAKSSLPGLHPTQSLHSSTSASRLPPRRHVPETYNTPPESQLQSIEAFLLREMKRVLKRIDLTSDTTKDTVGITIPYHWNSTLQQATYKAAKQAPMLFAGNHVLLRLPRALEVAYQLNSDVGTAVFNDAGIDFDELCFSIVVDYNHNYLYLLFCDDGLVER